VRTAFLRPPVAVLELPPPVLRVVLAARALPASWKVHSTLLRLPTLVRRVQRVTGAIRRVPRYALLVIRRRAQHVIAVAGARPPPEGR